MRVTKPRSNTSAVTHRTGHSRSLEINSLLVLASGGEASIQLQDEVRSCNKDERQALLEEFHNGGFKVEVTPEHSLAMKAVLTIPWAKLRVIRRLVGESVFRSKAT